MMVKAIRASLFCGLVTLLAGSANAVDQPVDVTNSYLDNVGNLSNTATVLDLSTLLFGPGDVVRLEAVGTYSLAGSENLPSAPITNEMIGVFSSSSTLLNVDAFNPRSRVVDAIEAGFDVVTDWDIAEDFFIGQTTITIPANATHLFLAPLDGFVGDNADDNNDFAVRITAVPEPATAVLLNIIMLPLFIRRRKLG